MYGINMDIWKSKGSFCVFFPQFDTVTKKKIKKIIVNILLDSSFHLCVNEITLWFFSSNKYKLLLVTKC